MKRVKSEKLKADGEGILASVKTFSRTLFRAADFEHFSRFAIHFSLLLFAFCLSASAQEEPYEDTAPPPLKIISKEEKSSLEAEIKVTGRTKLALALMENRLKRAEDFNARSLYGEMSDELGGFNALMDNTLVFLNKNNTGRGKVLNNFKRLELSLRRFVPRIELIRRELPAKYEFYVRNLIKNVRAARSKAVEPFFGDSVVPDNDKGN